MPTKPKIKRARKPARKKARRTQEQRRRETIDRILHAAIDLLVRRGYAGFSTIAVAAHAGVSRGAREHVFKTKYDLIEAAWRAALQRAETRSRRQAGKVRSSSDPVEDFLKSSRSFFLSNDYVALLELAMAARNDRKVARIFHDLFKENRPSADRVWIDAFVRAGYARDDVARFVDLANCVFRGAAMMSAWKLPASHYRTALDDLRRHARLCLVRGKASARPTSSSAPGSGLSRP